MKKYCIVLFCCFSSIIGLTQKNVTTFGLQYKPIIPNRLIGTFEQDFNIDQFQSTIYQRMGNSFGMIVRHGLSKNFSFEWGLNYTQRRFGVDFAVPDSGYATSNLLRTVNYELPISGLMFVQLADDIFMNTSLGVAVTMNASAVRVISYTNDQDFFRLYAEYNSKVSLNFIANYGFEYRTKDKGYFYLGASYNLPIFPYAIFESAYFYPGGEKKVQDYVTGSYLTVDFRYFFHEKAKTNSPKKK